MPTLLQNSLRLTPDTNNQRTDKSRNKQLQERTIAFLGLMRYTYTPADCFKTYFSVPHEPSWEGLGVGHCSLKSLHCVLHSYEKCYILIKSDHAQQKLELS